MRTLLSAIAAMALLGAMMFVQAQAPKGKGGGKNPPKNLKVLAPENLMANMQTFAPALGVENSGGCNYCHVADDRSSDEKPQKVMARMMIEMVRDINARFPDGATHVTCWTCHRGTAKPETSK